MVKHNVLSTKKLDPSLVEMVKAEGIDVLEQEAIAVKPILTKEKWNEIFSLLEKNIEHAVFTSSNAVTALKKYLSEYVNPLPQHWKIFCLSGKTKEVLQENKELFGTIEGTAFYATELAKIIISHGVKEVLFFCGNRRRDVLPTVLGEKGIHVHEVVVYTTTETPQKAAENFDAVLFFSPTAVQSFFAANQLKADAVCFAIGQTTADSVKQFTQNKLCMGKEPTQEALLQEVIAYFKTR